MDLAHHIVEIARENERRESMEAAVTIEIMHNIFDDYSCSQWIRLHRDPKDPGGDVVVQYRTARMRFKNVKEFNKTAADLIIQAILNDALAHADVNIFTDMDYITMNVHKRKQRLSVSHTYFKTEIYGDDLCNWETWITTKQARIIRDAFRRQVAFAWKAL